MDELYVQCDGVTTPDGLYYDPDNSIEGEWSDKVSAKNCLRMSVRWGGTV